MKAQLSFKKDHLAVSALLMGIGAGARIQLPSLFPTNADQIQVLAVLFFAFGVVVAISAFVEISRSANTGTIHTLWRADLVELALRRASPQATISLLQTSFPNAADLVPLLKELLSTGGKQFKIRLLLTNPFTANGKAVIAARMRLRDQDAASHELEIEDHLKQFTNLKDQIDVGWESERDQAKLDLQIRLYEHLPFGPQYHIEGDDSFIGFFVAKHSSVRAPMLQLRKENGKSWECFQEDFLAAWNSAEPYGG